MSAGGAPITPGGARTRFAILDMARGVAIVAMVVYHAAWDLWFYGLVATDIPYHPFWANFARSIAASFLILVGIGLVLAHETAFDARAFAIRLAKVAGAAALVTIGTRAFFPESFVYFGILHMIALGSVLALPFLRLPTAVTAAAALLVLIAPAIYETTAFDTRWLAWIGFAANPPPTNDFEPVFPWFAAVLGGVALGRLAFAGSTRERLSRIAARERPARGLVLLGRWSLVIYLVHQPILLGLLWPVAQVLGPAEEVVVRECRATCEANGSSEAFCIRYCGCAVAAIRAENLMSVVEGDATAEATARFEEVVAMCAAQALEDLPAPE